MSDSNQKRAMQVFPEGIYDNSSTMRREYWYRDAAGVMGVSRCFAADFVAQNAKNGKAWGYYPDVPNVVDASVAHNLVLALMELTYLNSNDGTLCVGINGDSEVPDSVREALIEALKVCQISPTSQPGTWSKKDLFSLVGRAGLEPATKGL